MEQAIHVQLIQDDTLDNFPGTKKDSLTLKEMNRYTNVSSSTI